MQVIRVEEKCGSTAIVPAWRDFELNVFIIDVLLLVIHPCGRLN